MADERGPSATRLTDEAGWATGRLEGKWHYEESPEATRLGIRIRDVLHVETSPFQKIAVYDTNFFGRMMVIDDLVMFTERDEFVYHEMLTHVPLCSMPDPRSVLVIGGGDCGCLREILRHPGVERVVQCEIDERVTRVAEQFFPWVKPAMADPRVELIFDDGAAYMRSQEGAFDLIIIDSTDPVGAAVPLFRAGFYREVACALKPRGVMTAQTESPHWTPALVGSIYREQRQAFEHVSAYMGSIPTYQSGVWSWSYAANRRRHDDDFDKGRAAGIARDALYYNPEVHHGAFALPNFARAAVDGHDLFTRFDRREKPSPSRG